MNLLALIIVNINHGRALILIGVNIDCKGKCTYFGSPLLVNSAISKNLEKIFSCLTCPVIHKIESAMKYTSRSAITVSVQHVRGPTYPML